MKYKINQRNDCTLNQVVPYHLTKSWAQMVMFDNTIQILSSRCQKTVENVHCDCSQCVKIPNKGLGLLPETDFASTSQYISLDSSLKTYHFNGKFYAQTCIDTTTNLVELVCVDIKSSDAIPKIFQHTWLVQSQDQDELSMIIVTNLQDIHLPIFSKFLESKIFL